MWHYNQKGTAALYNTEQQTIRCFYITFSHIKSVFWHLYRPDSALGSVWLISLTDPWFTDAAWHTTADFCDSSMLTYHSVFSVFTSANLSKLLHPTMQSTLFYFIILLQYRQEVLNWHIFNKINCQKRRGFFFNSFISFQHFCLFFYLVSSKGLNSFIKCENLVCFLCIFLI